MNTNKIGSDVVTALEAVWHAIQRRHPDVPDVVVITGSGLEGAPRWGHFARDRWVSYVVEEDDLARARTPELFIAGERLNAGAADTLETLLHEAAHALAHVRGEQDTSRQGRYHNRRFLAIAQELGLTYPHSKPDGTYGFSDTALTDDTRRAYADVMDALDRAITASLELPDWLSALGTGTAGTSGSGGDAPSGGRRGGRAKKGSRLLKATCACGRVIRVARSTFEAAVIRCESCHQPFELDNSDTEDRAVALSVPVAARKWRK